MNLLRYAYSKNIFKIILVAVFLLSITNLLRTFKSYPTRVSKKHHKLSAAVDSIDNQALSDHRNIRGLEKKRIKKQEKLIFEPRLDVVMPEGYQVQLRGLKQLPNNFEQSLNDYKQEQFRFRLQPLRIISDKGLLKIREFQGSSWTGTLMKGAIVFFVQSSVNHNRRRMLQRSTWGTIREIDGWKIEIVFVIGSINDPIKQSSLARENVAYGDLLQYHGTDYASSSTLKVLASLYWAADKLPCDFYHASITDDVLVDVAAIRDYISSQAFHFVPVQDRVYTMIARDGSTVTASKPQKIYCFEKYVEKEEPLRDFQYWRSVSQLDYDAPFWPPYCSEGLYILPVSLARELYDEWRILNASLPPELHDVLVTGILRRKLNRGDDNISSSAEKLQPLRRYKVLARSTSRRLASYELDAENQVKITWKKWYEKLRYRFHILTNV